MVYPCYRIKRTFDDYWRDIPIYEKTFVKSNVFGKANTVVMFCAMVILLVSSETSPQLRDVMLISAVITNAAAMISYVYAYFIKHKNFKNISAKVIRRKFYDRLHEHDSLGAHRSWRDSEFYRSHTD